MTIAKELEDRLFLIADPATRWVPRAPAKPGQVCLLADYSTIDPSGYDSPMSLETEYWLDDFVANYATAPADDGFDVIVEAAEFNDSSTRREVVWMLEEAVDLAKSLGV